MISLLGITAGLLLAASAIPQVVKVIRQGHAEGLSLQTALLVFFGLAFMASYTYLRFGFDPIFHCENILSASLWLVLIAYRVRDLSV